MRATVRRVRLFRSELVYAGLIFVLATVALLPANPNYPAYLLLCFSTLPISVVAIPFFFFVGLPTWAWLGDNVGVRFLFALSWATLAALQLRAMILIARDLRQRRGTRKSPHYGGEQPPDGYAPQPRMDGTAITVLVLAIASFGTCAITAIVALVMAPRAQRNIDSSGGNLMGEGLVRAGRVISWINVGMTGALLLVLAVSVIVGDPNEDVGAGLPLVVQ